MGIGGSPKGVLVYSSNSPDVPCQAPWDWQRGLQQVVELQESRTGTLLDQSEGTERQRRDEPLGEFCFKQIIKACQDLSEESNLVGRTPELVFVLFEENTFQSGEIGLLREFVEDEPLNASQ